MDRMSRLLRWTFCRCRFAGLAAAGENDTVSLIELRIQYRYD